MAEIGHNNPPSPIELTLAPFDDALAEAANWLDGEPVSSSDQLKAVDALAKRVKAARKAIKDARDEAVTPLHDAWKAEVARWKPTEDDLDRIVKGLAAISDGYKRKLAEEQAAARRAAYEEAERKKREAEAAQAAADAGDLEAQRQAAAAKQEALDAAKKAAATKVEVRGLRTVHKYEIRDHKAVLHWIAANDRDALTAFIEGYVAKNHRGPAILGVNYWTEKEAF